MTLVFLTNLVNHHQIPLADEFYRILGDNYVYVAFEPLPDWLKRGGYQEIERPYVLRAYESKENFQKALELTNKADVVMHGHASLSYTKDRIEAGKVTFRAAERWFKNRRWYTTGPRGWMNFYRYHIRYRNKPLYMLCASAYTALDVSKIFAYPNKCYKWGYMTAVPEFDVVESLKARSASTVKILWIARFLQWKHPERMLQLAEYLNKKGYDYEINMIGGGELFDRIESEIKGRGLDNKIHLLGNMPNPEVVERIREHHIFCFTSDRNEGWGAVLNEAMSGGCCPVASNKIGAAPFLIKHGENGFLYEDSSVTEFCERVEFLINNPTERERMAINAYNTMRDVWSPKNAAESFIRLASEKLKGNEIYEISDGPCSKAPIL